MKTLKPSLPTLRHNAVKSLTDEAPRMTGLPLQRRRLRIWERDASCAMCGRTVAYPKGFELDHVVPLWQGGADTDNNCQLLCVYHLPDGTKAGCHADKTAMEAAERATKKIH